MADAVLPSTIGATAVSSSQASAAAAAVTKNASIANNFQTFLTLLTTQLKNQNPLDPLDTNQFTQQLVQFSQVEQQMKANDQLTQLVQFEKVAQTTAALAYVNATVAIDGSTAKLANGSADWTFSSTKPASAKIVITAPTGQTAYSGDFAINAGNQAFSWDGRGNDGTLWPDGNYKLTITATDSSGQSTAVTTEVQGKVEAVDVSQSPPVLTIAGQPYSFDKIRRIIGY
ncbi:MAG: flagellar hook assembly protein FlgD [Pseudolabrys sp.]